MLTDILKINVEGKKYFTSTFMKERVVTTAFCIGCVFLFTFHQSDQLKASVERGKSIYEANCMSCHMAEGQGLEGAFPPLANTGRLSDKGRLVKILFNGISGPITVKGKDYDMEMTPVNLSNEEVADVLNYIRNSWGNKNIILTVDEVKKIRTQ